MRRKDGASGRRRWRQNVRRQQMRKERNSTFCLATRREELDSALLIMRDEGRRPTKTASFADASIDLVVG